MISSLLFPKVMLHAMDIKALSKVKEDMGALNKQV